MDVKYVIDLMKAVSEHGLTEFEMEHGELRLLMKRETAAREGISKEFVSVAEQKPVTEEIEIGDLIKSPLVGTFYSAPSPDAEPFVKVGDPVKKGQVVGIVEAMKLMNEIESEFDGIVEAILIDNESIVEYGQPLVRIR